MKLTFKTVVQISGVPLQLKGKQYPVSCIIKQSAERIVLQSMLQCKNDVTMRWSVTHDYDFRTEPWCYQGNHRVVFPVVVFITHNQPISNMWVHFPPHQFVLSSRIKTGRTKKPSCICILATNDQLLQQFFFFFIVITHSTLWRIGCFRRIPLTSQLVSGRLSHHHNRHRYPPFIHHRYHYLSLSFLLFLRILSTSSRTKWGRFSQDSFADTESGGRD